MSRPSTTIKSLVQGFARHIRELKAPDYKESQVRKHYIDPFWKVLGWDVDNDEQRAPQDLDVLIEPSTDSAEDDGLRSRQPDYVFRANGFARFIVEAKKPAGAEYTFERGVGVTGAGSAGSRGDFGFADVWWRGKFAWEYKRRGRSGNMSDRLRR